MFPLRYGHAGIDPFSDHGDLVGFQWLSFRGHANIQVRGGDPHQQPAVLEYPGFDNRLCRVQAKIGFLLERPWQA